ncbi:MAG: 16S rRNA (cytidine(1402)-2'-O)-methyltransferase [Mitsuaria chitosanitabida]|uniref:16S rRNA (cytidine(1402)-2'-O)-methyltransferase n=1 Tax=Roseateles chitosanitabidus TaxID=65048 RepID=UPI001B1F28F4|nr:16S rRNA (cytidine(1402)-2'-O)-methyltransferase [Roseateles chitosanitabidus]MBO9686932.1 16S rRNA (cytidine(1402)-2'-O)-methyltransferase [Roseateles chitosanitabidus]
MSSSPSASMSAAAAAAAGHQQYPGGTLYMVATPIGNLADLSLRAIHVLGLVDAVACEDTRVSAQLLRWLGLHKPLVALHQHNEQQAAEGLVARLLQGERIAYVSDAGTPAISDPGAALVAAAAKAGVRVVPLPGASSAAAALSVAGDTRGQGFRFVGFLPTKAAERRSTLQALTGAPHSQVLFEAPHRIQELIALLAELAPTQTLTICREVTKQFETIHTAPCASLPAWMAEDKQRERGEFVLVLHAAPAQQDADGLPEEALRTLRVLVRDLPLKQAAALAAELTGVSRKALYQQALDWKQGADDDGSDAAAGEDEGR